MKKFYLILLSILGGVILSLGWPVNGFPGLLFLGFIPFLFIEDHIRKNRMKFGRVSVFLYTYPGFFTWNILTTWWIWNSSMVGAILAFILNTMFMSLVFHAYHISRKQLSHGQGFFILVFYWITFEYFHHNWDGTWPWLSLGNGLAGYIKWIQWYEYTGIFGGTFWILSVNILLYKALKGMFSGCFTNRKILFNGLGGVLLFIIPLIISLIIFNRYEEKYNPVDVIVVQPNIDPYTEQYTLPVLTIIEKNLDLASEKLDSNVTFIVSPESAIPGKIWEHQLDYSFGLNRVRAFNRNYPGLQIVIGASTAREYEEDEEPSATARKFSDTNIYYDAYNTAFCIDASGDLQIYHKSKLTPAVEKMPFPELFKPLERFAIDLGGHVGSLGVDKERKVFTREQDHLKTAPVICYETVFGEYMAGYIRNGAHLIFVITNDGWWGNTPGHRQHFTFSQMRAIESRRSVARSANTGISAFINQRGEAFQMTQYWVPAVIRQEINANDKITFYVRYGDYIARVCGYVSALLILITISRNFINRKRKT